MTDMEKETPETAAEFKDETMGSETAASPEGPQADAAAGGERTVPDIPKHEVEAIIRKRVYAAMTIGMAPVPLLDLAGISAVQVELVRALAKKYGVPFRADVVKTIIGSLVGSVVPLALAPAAASLAKFIPLIGWTASWVSLSLLGGASTYAIGNVFWSHFQSGGALLDFDTEKVRSSFQSKVQEGKALVGKWRKAEQTGS